MLQRSELSTFFRIILFFVLYHLFAYPALGQKEENHFISFGDYLNGRPISSFSKDSLGFIWIATHGSGLYRFDGVSYERYYHNRKDSTSLNSDLVRVTFNDSQDNIWVGTDNGLNLFNKTKECFERILLDSNNTINVFAIAEMYNGQLLLGVDRNGIIIRGKEKDSKAIFITSDDINTTRNFSIFDISSQDDTFFYLATNQGLFLYNALNKTLKKANYPFMPDYIQSARLQSVYLDNNGTLWLGTIRKGVLKVSLSKQNYIQYAVTRTRIMDICKSDNKIYAASENDGLFVFNENNEQPTNIRHNLKKKNALASNAIWTLFKIGKDKFLLGYYEAGIGLYDACYFKFQSISHDPFNLNSLTHPSVSSIWPVGDSVIWLGMDGGGIIKYLSKQNKYIRINKDNQKYLKGLNDNDIESIFIDSQENMWVATQNRSGFYMLPKGERTFIKYSKENNPESLITNKISCFAEDSLGRVWIGTEIRGLYSYNLKSKKFKHYGSVSYSDRLLFACDIRDLLVDRNNTLWIGTHKGLYQLKESDNEFDIINMKNKPPFTIFKQKGDNIVSLFEDSKGNIWIGTNGSGVYCYSPSNNILEWISSVDGLKQGIICGITEDKLGNIWLTGKNGVSVININTKNIQNFTTSDGLLSNNFNNGALIYSKLLDQIYLGSVKGLNYIDKNFEEHSEKIDVHLKDLKLYNKKVLPNEKGSPLNEPLSETEELVLNQNQTVFTIDYLGFDFPYSDRLNYAYYLEGPEQEWNYVGESRSATYTSLPKGDYTFHVKASGIDGQWSEEKTLHIRVLPHWYQSTGAYMAYLIILVAGIYIFIQILRVRIKAREEVNRERDKRLQEEALTQTKLQFFTNISHEFRTPLTLILNPITDLVNSSPTEYPMKKKYWVIYRNALRLKSLIDELMDFKKLSTNTIQLKVSEVSPETIINDIIPFFEEEAKSRSIQLTCQNNYDSSLLLYWDVKMIEKIIFNLLSNAFKITPDGGAITLHLEDLSSTGKNYFRLSIKDTGIGMSKDEIKHIFNRFYQVEKHQKAYYGGTGIGLEVVKQFVELHKGKINVESQENIGTTFLLDFPLGKSHLNENQIFAANIQHKKDYIVPEHDTTTTEITSNNHNDPKKTTILIIEDNYELRGYLKDGLKPYYKIITASDGVIGLKKANEKPIDLIISDVMMPNMDGYELCRRIKADIRTSHIPLILLTAKSAESAEIKGIDSGADAYFSKPFNFDILLGRISQILKTRQILFEKFVGGISEKKNLSNTTSVDKDFLQIVTQHVYENISDPDLNVGSLAEVLHLSRSQLYRKVKALTGITATEFIRRIKLEEAKKLLIESNNSISEICYKMGFSSPSYFTKCYKEYFNRLPTDEKKSEG